MQISSYKEFEQNIGYLNITSIRNKFGFLVHQVKGNTDILMISETNLMKVFLLANFFWMATVSFSALIGMAMAAVFCYILKKIYHPNFYQLIKT